MPESKERDPRYLKTIKIGWLLNQDLPWIHLSPAITALTYVTWSSDDVTSTWLPVNGEKYADVTTRVRCKELSFDFAPFTFRMSQKATDLKNKNRRKLGCKIWEEHYSKPKAQKFLYVDRLSDGVMKEICVFWHGRRQTSISTHTICCIARQVGLKSYQENTCDKIGSGPKINLRLLLVWRLSSYRSK